MAYDTGNIFAQILRGEIPNDTVHEDENVLAFRDLDPVRPVHVLVIPRGAYTDAGDFAANATESEIVGFWRGVAATVIALDVSETGYRLIANTGIDGGQEVPHFHVHILGGGAAGPMVSGV